MVLPTNIRKASLCPGQTKCALFAHLSASGHLHTLVSPLVATSDYLVGQFSALYIRLRHTYTFSVGVLKTSGANSWSWTAIKVVVVFVTIWQMKEREKEKRLWFELNDDGGGGGAAAAATASVTGFSEKNDGRQSRRRWLTGRFWAPRTDSAHQMWPSLCAGSGGGGGSGGVARSKQLIQSDQQSVSAQWSRCTSFPLSSICSAILCFTVSSCELP